MSKRKEPTFNQWDAIEVEWVDSERSDGWRTTSDDDEPVSALTCRTVGMFYRVNDEWLEVVLSGSGFGKRSEQYCGSITIPRCAITTIRRLV